MGELASIFLSMSDAALDAKAKLLIEKWDDEPTAKQILEVLDWCIHCALANGFVISSLQAFYDIACRREEKTHEELVKNASWRLN
jgi:hypothetical protein